MTINKECKIKKNYRIEISTDKVIAREAKRRGMQHSTFVRHILALKAASIKKRLASGKLKRMGSEKVS